MLVSTLQNTTTGTEAASAYTDLEHKDISNLLHGMNAEDLAVAEAVKSSLPQLEQMCGAIVKLLLQGGRLFYIGAGTSGRLGILDAAEIPPTYSMEGVVIAVIAGGRHAIEHAVENAEDDMAQGWRDLQAQKVTSSDFVLGLSASGTTPYVLGALTQCNTQGIATGCIVCNAHSPIATISAYPVEIQTGAEFVTGSTRMKAGSAQKMALNMVSTTLMIKMGRVKGNKMVEMKLSNKKLRNRGAQMLMQELGIEKEEAENLLSKEPNINKAMNNYRAGK